MSKRPDIERRRELVAHLAVRRIPLRKMSELLEQDGCLNPKTGQKWGFATLSRDVVKLEKQWRINASEAIDMHKARDLAELEELSTRAWSAKDFHLVLKCQERRSKLLGMDAPIKTEHSGELRTPGVLVLPETDPDPEEADAERSA